jgi:hypothetical protein
MFIETFLLNQSKHSDGRPNEFTAGLRAYGDDVRNPRSMAYDGQGVSTAAESIGPNAQALH